MLVDHWVGHASLALFVAAYGMVLSEEYTFLRKSKPMMLAAGVIWVLVALGYPGDASAVNEALLETLIEYSQLMLFLLAAMTYVNAMTERGVFDALRAWLLSKRLSYRKLFWITGSLAFCLSPVIDNLTTALVMGAVLMAVGAGNARFISLGCINIVVAANAGGAFSPFGDITTLMVWQRGLVPFEGFFALFVPSVVNFALPAGLMHFAVPQRSAPEVEARVAMKRGALVIVALFGLTLLTAVLVHNFLHLPPFLGMMMGLSYLSFFSYYLKRTSVHPPPAGGAMVGDVPPFDVFASIARAEWDTLLFFFGVIMCVGALSFIGHLALVSDFMYGTWDPTYANVVIGLISAVVDNIPIMVAVLEMRPDMVQGQWLLVTLTAGVGGSLLSIGSAAGVALMGQSGGHYTFFRHLRWTPAIAAGYVGSIVVHVLLNL